MRSCQKLSLVLRRGWLQYLCLQSSHRRKFSFSLAAEIDSVKLLGVSSEITKCFSLMLTCHSQHWANRLHFKSLCFPAFSTPWHKTWGQSGTGHAGLACYIKVADLDPAVFRPGCANSFFFQQAKEIVGGFGSQKEPARLLPWAAPASNVWLVVLGTDGKSFKVNLISCTQLLGISGENISFEIEDTDIIVWS